MAKLTDAAVHYDRNRDSIIMKAFEGSSMQPTVFKMQLARAFAIRLSEKEITALVQFFDKVSCGACVHTRRVYLYHPPPHRLKPPPPPPPPPPPSAPP